MDTLTTGVLFPLVERSQSTSANKITMEDELQRVHSSRFIPNRGTITPHQRESGRIEATLTARSPLAVYFQFWNDHR